MTAQTNSPPASLQELVAPFTEAEFLALLRERKLTLQRATSPDRYKTLIDWHQLVNLLERGQHPRGLYDVRLAKESSNVPRAKWTKWSNEVNRTTIDITKVKEYLAHGFSLIVVPIEAFVPPLAALCENLRAHVSEQVKLGVIVTSGTGGAFRLHFDPEDLIILQIEGTKRWRVYGPPVPNPVVGMPPHQPPEEAEPILDEVLRPGDLLFLPAGNWHHCQNGLGRSLHIGIFIVPPTAWHAAKHLASALVADELFRRPLSRVSTETDLVALEREIKNRLIASVETLKLRDFTNIWPKKAPDVE